MRIQIQKKQTARGVEGREWTRSDEFYLYIWLHPFPQPLT